jgi:Family of unknown function (DUF5829)
VFLGGGQLVKKKSRDRSSPTSQRSTTALQPDVLAPVLLNHFYVVLDSPTYNALEQDVFLRKHFAVNEKRTTTNADMTYTGLYFYGVNTYFEFFDVDSSPGRQVGDSGVAFGVEQSGNIRVLQEKLGASLEPNLQLVTRLYAGKQIPWFFMATPKSLPYESELSCWVMEYHPDFLAQWNPQPGKRNPGISRKEILERYSAVLEPVKEPILKDVIGLTVAADAPATGDLTDCCLKLGYQAQRKENEVVLRGPDFVLHLIPATEAVRGIREIKMRIRCLPEREIEQQLGHSALRFGDSSAIWSFR